MYNENTLSTRNTKVQIPKDTPKYNEDTQNKQKDKQAMTAVKKVLTAVKLQ